MIMQEKRTPGPWTLEGGERDPANPGVYPRWMICRYYWESPGISNKDSVAYLRAAAADAEYIVWACNLFEQLTEALKEILLGYERIRASCPKQIAAIRSRDEHGWEDFSQGLSEGHAALKMIEGDSHMTDSTHMPTKGAIQAARIITGGYLGDGDAYETMAGPKTFREIAELIDAQTAALQLAEALKETLGLIRKAQERLCEYLKPDSCHDERECMNELLELFDGPQQREIEGKAHAAFRTANVEYPQEKT